MKAFPSNYDPQTGSAEKGMTLRDYFAAKAMQGMLNGSTSYENVAKYAYKIADAMMKERNE